MADDGSSLDARVVVTGDYPLIRAAVARMIASERGMDVVAECANDSVALTAAMNAAPDLVVMDLDLDSRNGGRPEVVTPLLLCAHPHPVLILTQTDSDHASLSTALANGAWGVVLKDRPVEVFLRAMRAVIAGEAWLDPATLGRVFGGPQRRKTDAAAKLTRREREIVDLVCLGLKNKKIGERLFISETTVRHHLTSIFNKLAVTSRSELMHYSYSGRVARE